jgi:uncharacterized protein YjdB
MSYYLHTRARAHVQNIGWQDWEYSDPGRAVSVGTTGQSLRMEALDVHFYP